MRALICAAATAVALGACASSGPPQESYSAGVERLTEQCRARGGILTPVPNATHERPETDFACRISGGPSDRLRGD